MGGHKRKEVTEGKRKQGNEKPHNLYSFLILIGPPNQGEKAGPSMKMDAKSIQNTVLQEKRTLGMYIYRDLLIVKYCTIFCISYMFRLKLFSHQHGEPFYRQKQLLLSVKEFSLMMAEQFQSKHVGNIKQMCSSW
jgi:hypothetical protein